MRNRPAWERGARRIARPALRRVPLPLALAVIERAGPRYARLALRTGGRLLPRNVLTFPARVASLLGGPLGQEESDRLVEARLVFLLTRVLLNEILLVHPPAESRRRLAPIGVDGVDRLEAALGERRGVILVSGHFGFPPLIRLAVEEFGARVIGVGGEPARGVDVPVGGDVWDRARSLHHLRGELAENRVCVLLADLAHGRHTEVPFLGERIAVALGAFGLAQFTRSPLLPAFAVHSQGTPRFQVDIGRALPVPDRSRAEPPTEAVAGFVRHYEALARRYPSHLFGYDALFAS